MDNTYLQHYGVLGMKWGVRKAQEIKRNTVNKRSSAKSGLSKNPITRHAQKSTLKKIKKAQGHSNDPTTPIGEHSKAALENFHNTAQTQLDRYASAQRKSDRQQLKYETSYSDSVRDKAKKNWLANEHTASKIRSEGYRITDKALRNVGTALVKDVKYSSRNSKRMAQVNEYIENAIANNGVLISQSNFDMKGNRSSEYYISTRDGKTKTVARSKIQRRD